MSLLLQTKLDVKSVHTCTYMCSSKEGSKEKFRLQSPPSLPINPQHPRLLMNISEEASSCTKMVSLQEYVFSNTNHHLPLLETDLLFLQLTTQK